MTKNSKKNSKKHWMDLHCSEMNYGQFVAWAKTFVFDEFFKEGVKGLNSAIETVVTHVTQNEEFGGRSNSSKK